MGRIWTVVSVAAMALLYVPRGHGQSGKDKTELFDVMETTIGQVRTAYKSGKLTAHQLVQAYLDRINAYDKQGPKINSIITLNPEGLGRGRQVGRAV